MQEAATRSSRQQKKAPPLNVRSLSSHSPVRTPTGQAPIASARDVDWEPPSNSQDADAAVMQETATKSLRQQQQRVRPLNMRGLAAQSSASPAHTPTGQT